LNDVTFSDASAVQWAASGPVMPVAMQAKYISNVGWVNLFSDIGLTVVMISSELKT
jgi:hypothetical protein